MSQEQLGLPISITFQQIQKYEKGTNRVSASRLAEIAKVLKVPVSFFFPDETEGPGNQDDTIEAVTQFIATKDGYDLNKAFTQIKSPNTRRKIANLVKALADTA